MRFIMIRYNTPKMIGEIEIILKPKRFRLLTIPVRVQSLSQKINEKLRSRIIDGLENIGIPLKRITQSQNISLNIMTFLESMYNDFKEENMLSIINYRFIKQICEILGITTENHSADELHISGDKTSV